MRPMTCASISWPFSRNLQALRALSTLYVTSRKHMLFSKRFTKTRTLFTRTKKVQKRVAVRKDRLQAGGPFGKGHAQIQPWKPVSSHGCHPKENASLSKGGFGQTKHVALPIHDPDLHLLVLEAVPGLAATLLDRPTPPRNLRTPQ